MAKTTTKYYNSTKCWQEHGGTETLNIVGDTVKYYKHFENCLAMSPDVNSHLSYDSVISHVGIYLREMKTSLSRKRLVQEYS